MKSCAVACGHQITANAAETVLREGGSAADAVIAGAFAAMVAEPILAGLLGGGFCMLADGQQTKILDFFVQSPVAKARDLDFRAIEADFGTTRQEFHIGAGAIATPGIPTGLAELHAQAGRMPLTELAAPAIAAARAGVTITPFQAGLARIVAPILTASPEGRHLTCDDKGPLPAGTVATNPDFADVLDVFTREGPRFVMEGEVARALLSLTTDGGHLTARDLKRYRPIWRDPLMARRGTAQISLNPAPALGGPLIAFALALIERDDTPVEIARAFEATAHARLSAEGDPTGLLAPDLVDRFRQQTARHRASTRGTTHISVIDREGKGAALTLSNGEGCGLIAPGTGLMPNNMLGEADLIPGGHHDDWQSWHPDTRLASMMCPMAMQQPGRLTMLGSGGSSRIRTALAQVLLNLTDREMRLEDAISAPRLHAETDGVDVEALDRPEPELKALQSTWPEARIWPDPSMFFGGVHAVTGTPKGATEAAGDPRRAGTARLF